jgi:hypothetical protein
VGLWSGSSWSAASWLCSHPGALSYYLDGWSSSWNSDVVVVTSGCAVVVVGSSGGREINQTPGVPNRLAVCGPVEAGIDRGAIVVVVVRERRNDVTPAPPGKDGAGVFSVTCRRPVRHHGVVFVHRILNIRVPYRASGVTDGHLVLGRGGSRCR